MTEGTCKVCGANFWESYPGARGEDICDACEDRREQEEQAIANTPNLVNPEFYRPL